MSLQRRSNIFEKRLDNLKYHFVEIREEKLKFHEHFQKEKQNGQLFSILSTTAITLTIFAFPTILLTGLLFNKIVDLFDGSKLNKNINIVKSLLDGIRIEIASMDSLISYIVEDMINENSKLSEVKCDHLLKRIDTLRKEHSPIVTGIERNFKLLQTVEQTLRESMNYQDKRSILYLQAFVNVTELFVLTDQKLNENISSNDIDKILKILDDIKKTYQEIFHNFII